jgi:glycosyltransferase involved in cell wall biosynthesis
MTPHVCFVGLQNLPVLAPEFEQHGMGGAQLQQTLLAKALVKRGITVSMVVGDYGQPDGAVWSGIRTYRAYSAREGIPVVRFLHPRWTKLTAALRRANADVYYVSCASAEVGQVAMWATRNDRSMVFRVASEADCDPKRVLIAFWRDRQLYAYGLRRADAILAQNRAQQELLRSNYGVESLVASPLVEGSEHDVALEERNIGLLWVSNIQQLKRPEMFIELARRLGPGRADMAGGPYAGVPHLFEEARQQASQVPNLTFHGRLPYRATGRLFDHARVFVNTSEVEGFPNTFLQSWVRGVPVVSFFDPDNVIQREGLGYAVSNLDEMTEAARRLTADAALWLEVSTRCRAYMARRYNEAEIAAPYLETLERLAQPRRTRVSA